MQTCGNGPIPLAKVMVEKVKSCTTCNSVKQRVPGYPINYPIGYPGPKLPENPSTSHNRFHHLAL